MNPDLKTPLDLPPVNWDKVLIRSAALMLIVTVIAFATRARTLIRVAEVIDIAVILGLLGFIAYAIIARYARK